LLAVKGAAIIFLFRESFSPVRERVGVHLTGFSIIGSEAKFSRKWLY
jgi:hypothetical protein